MTDQYTKDFFAALPQDKPTTWAWDDAPEIKEGYFLMGYIPALLSDEPKAILMNELFEVAKFSLSDLTIEKPSPKTLKGVLYQGWFTFSDKTIHFEPQHTLFKEETNHAARHLGYKPYGYRTLDPETGTYGPMVIVGGGDE